MQLRSIIKEANLLHLNMLPVSVGCGLKSGMWQCIIGEWYLMFQRILASSSLRV